MTPANLTPPPTNTHAIAPTVRSFHDLPAGGKDLPLMNRFATAVRLFCRNYFRVSGRATRAEFWWVVLFHATLIALWHVAGILMTGGQTLHITQDTHPLSTGVALFLSTAPRVWKTLSLIPFITLLARRFHDTDSSAALLLTWLIPVMGLVVTLIYALTPSNPRGARFDAPRRTATLSAERGGNAPTAAR